MNEPWFYAVWTVGAFVVGTLPVGDLVARTKGVDIRALGTGNPGSANIYREIGPAHGVAVFLLDVSKGAVATVPLLLLDLPSWSGLAATTAVVGGHLFPFLWRIKGGTGMAVALGTMPGLLPLGVLVSAPLGVVWFVLKRNPAQTGAIVFVVTAVAGGLMHREPVAVLAVALAAVAIAVKARVQYGGR